MLQKKIHKGKQSLNYEPDVNIFQIPNKPENQKQFNTSYFS